MDCQPSESGDFELAVRLKAAMADRDEDPIVLFFRQPSCSQRLKQAPRSMRPFSKTMQEVTDLQSEQAGSTYRYILIINTLTLP